MKRWVNVESLKVGGDKDMPSAGMCLYLSDLLCLQVKLVKRVEFVVFHQNKQHFSTPV